MSVIDKSNIPLAGFNAASVASTGTLVTGWVDVGACSLFHTMCFVGSGAGTPALTFEQATSSAGAGAKALSVSAGTFASSKVEVTNDPAKLDIPGGFRYVRVTATVTGGAGTLLGLAVLQIEPRFAA